MGSLIRQAECFLKNLCDIVTVGSILKVGLKGGDFHTGIYIGDDQIVELTNIDGDAIIRTVSAEEFIEDDAFIYVACGVREKGDYCTLGGQKIADRAEEAIGQNWNGITDINCHMFCQYCITGRKNGNSWLFGIENALKEVFPLDEIEWRPIGVKPEVGAILNVALWGGLIDDSVHTGIYIGDNQIVELTDIDGDAIIRIVSAEEFIGYSKHRTGYFIYVACGKRDNGDFVHQCW